MTFIRPCHTHPLGNNSVWGHASGRWSRFDDPIPNKVNRKERKNRSNQMFSISTLTLTGHPRPTSQHSSNSELGKSTNRSTGPLAPTTDRPNVTAAAVAACSLCPTCSRFGGPAPRSHAFQWQSANVRNSHSLSHRIQQMRPETETPMNWFSFISLSNCCRFGKSRLVAGCPWIGSPLCTLLLGLPYL